MEKKSGIYNTALEAIGNTPIVRLNNIPKAEGIKCEILAKCEFFNAGGSVKDRIGKQMIEDAEASGRCKPGDTLIEATSGNTGIGMALAAAIKGYKMIITLPEKMSQEKVDVLKALGAQIIRTPTEAAFDSPESHIGVAKKLNAEIPNSHILDQYTNPSNPGAHSAHTGPEIWEQCEGRIDYVVMGAGTGGTISGVAEYLKSKDPKIQIVGVDPHGSILAEPASLNGQITSYHVEGIGYDFIPDVLDRKLVDKWIKSADKESFLLARRLIREEGLLCGGSSGTALYAALEVAKDLPADKRVVVLLPDSVRNYMTKFLNVDWMIERGFMDAEEAETDADRIGKHLTINDMKLGAAQTVESSLKVSECISLMESTGFDQLPVVENSKLLGVVTIGYLTRLMTLKKVTKDSTIESAIQKAFVQVKSAMTLDKLSQVFEKHSFALATEWDGDSLKSVNVVTNIDLLKFLRDQE